MIDKTLLAFFRRRAAVDRMMRAVPKSALDSRTQVILDDFARYFRAVPDASEVQFEPFMLMFAAWHPSLNDEQRAVFRQLIGDALNTTLDASVTEGMARTLAQLDVANQITERVTALLAGEEVDLRRELVVATERLDGSVARRASYTECLDSIEELLASAENKEGFRWPWAALNEFTQPLTGGDFVILAARPDHGKTTMLAHALTHFAQQVDKRYPGQNRHIIWFNNEGKSAKLRMRMYQAALGATTSELIELAHQPAKKGAFTSLVHQRFVEATGGRDNIIRIVDAHDMWTHQVEDVFATLCPAIITFDMLDNMRWSGGSHNGGSRPDQMYEEMYKWGRNLGIKYDAPVIATSQVSADADGQPYPGLANLKESKTGKQGTADLIVTLGATDPNVPNRFIGFTKSKLQVDGQPKSPRAEVILDGARARIKEFA